MSARNRLLGQIRLVLVFLFIIALITLSRPTPRLLWIGGALVLIGESIRLWSAGHLVKSVKLIISGPYAYCQNPLYLGRLLILTGLGIAARIDGYLNLVALAIGYAIFFFYYMPRKLQVEGDRLAQLHGPAFAAYRMAVPILFPSLRRYPGGDARWSFMLMVRNQELLVFIGLILAMGVLGWKGMRP